MKKIKALFCTLLLSTVLVGNVFAGGFTTVGVFSFFDSVMNAIVLMARAPMTAMSAFARIVNPERKMMVMAIADRLNNFDPMQTHSKTKQILVVLFLLCFAFTLKDFAQTRIVEKQIETAQIEFDNGDFARAIDVAQATLETAKKANDKYLISECLILIGSSQISLHKYEDAEVSLIEALKVVSDSKLNSDQKPKIYIHLAWLWRTKREFVKALDFSKKAIAEAPTNKHFLGEHYLNLGRILFSSGYDISAIIWLEKAEKIFETEKTSSAKLDNYRFLHLAWSSRLNYQKALYYAEKWVKEAEKSRFKHKYRQALFELSTIQSSTGQKNAAFSTMEKGREISLIEKNHYQAGLFLSSLLLNSLYKFDVEKAAKYLEELVKINSDGAYSFEILLGKAVISAFKNQHKVSEELFVQLDKMENTSEFILPSWKIIIAKRNKEWEKVIKLNQEVLALNERDNFRDGLPGVYLNFAEAYFHLGQTQKSLENLEKTLSLIEEVRKSENKNLSLGILENYHNAYRLLAQIKAENSEESFELADFLKARFLKDKINNSVLKTEVPISLVVQQNLEKLSSVLVDDQSVIPKIEKYEKEITNQLPELNIIKPNLNELNKIVDLEGKAIISYFFTLDRKLLAFVWEKDKPLKIHYLPISEEEVELYAKAVPHKIKNLIFFKRDGKEIHDKLLKPLNLTAKHLIIIPDKSLWKIPFQALSPDGEQYLIEEKLISYAPSVSILLEQLRSAKPIRQSLQALQIRIMIIEFSNTVNSEAAGVAQIYNSKPYLNATVADYERNSEKVDILHLSMHAEVNNEQPLESFLGFRKFGKDDGRLTVEEHLKMKVKKGSLVFLASCDTNNVLNGEGLVSLAWAMMGSGATTVISAQWEANDKSTEIFTKAFYNQYKLGEPSAEALQKAALELIRNKANNMHEPYYWAYFTINGDYR